MECHHLIVKTNLNAPYTIRQGRNMNLSIKILVAIGSSTSIGFGIWHFFVPKIWNWYSYMEKNAKELVIAVQAINVFFSLSLILFGIMNMLLVFARRPHKYSLIVVLGATCLLWLTRVLMQIIFPQGTMNPFLQYGMLCTFILIFLVYSIAFGLIMNVIFA